MSDTAQKETKKKKAPADSKAFAAQFFQEEKDFHYNLIEPAKDYLVSSGSLILDCVLDGGFGSGLHRFCGANEAGKTHEAFQVCLNFINTVPNSKGLYVNAEGRLPEKLKKRTGLKFVYKPEEWEVGTVLVFESNIYDTVFDFIRGILKNNPNREQFCIIIDSIDALIPKGDLDKTTSEAGKVAAGALLTSDFLKRVNLGMGKMGHMCIMLSQVRAHPKISQFQKSDPNNRTNSSGGNAAHHYPNWVLEFQKQNQGDRIVEHEGPISMDNPAIGHNAKVKVCKSDNEKTDMLIQYPIKYGRTGGRSIWIEREVAEMLLSWEFMERPKGKKGSWYSVSEDFKEVLDTLGLESFPEKIQGLNKINTFLEENVEICEALKGYFLTLFKHEV